MGLDAETRAKFNLRNASILVVEGGVMDMQILVQMLVGFGGGKHLHKHEKIADAKFEIARVNMDLMIIGGNLPDGDGCDLATWIRHEASEPNRFAPIIMVTGHTPLSKVARARDCGAHFIIAKPLTPAVLLERIIWIGREQRVFVEDPAYCGPDRRFRFEGPPPGTSGRRKDDLKGKLSVAGAPNMSQDQIDALMQPRKVSL